jgi:N-acetylmuramoyl-L-alanine amidase
MIKRLLIFILLSAFFTCAQNVVFYEFDNNFSTYSQNEKERIYDNLKRVYIKSIMDSNDSLRYEVLNRLVGGAKELGYDISAYKAELNGLLKYQNITQTVQNKNLQSKTDKYSKQSADTIVYAVDVVNVIQTTEIEQKEESAVSSNISNKLLQIKKDNGSIIFLFDKNIEEKDIKFLNLKGNNIRYIYDVKGIKTNFAVDFKIDGIEDFRISQFDKETVRIVFECKEETNITYNTKDSKLIFSAKEFIGSSSHVDVESSRIKGNKTAVTANALSDKVTPKITISQKTIVIDAGHGGKDGGAVSNKKLEKEAVLQIALLLGAELEKRGHKVFYTRTKDIYLKLQERTKTANDKNADIFISVHANAAPKNSKNNNWQGIETFFLSPSDSVRSKNAAELENQSDIEEMNMYSRQTFLNFLNREKIIASHKLAIDIQQYILTEIKKSYKKVVDGGVREAPFWVLTGAQMPAVLLEVGYITDKTDRERMFDKKFQQILVTGIANGIESYFTKNM